jgi:hypothetical protein
MVGFPKKHEYNDSLATAPTINRNKRDKELPDIGWMRVGIARN